jgi:hypothetical protein
MPTLRPKGTAFEKRKAVRKSDPGAAHLDKMLDEALRETFPASDPVAITIEKPSKADALDRPETLPISPHPDLFVRLFGVRAGRQTPTRLNGCIRRRQAYLIFPRLQ